MNCFDKLRKNQNLKKIGGGCGRGGGSERE